MCSTSPPTPSSRFPFRNSGREKNLRPRRHSEIFIPPSHGSDNAVLRRRNENIRNPSRQRNSLSLPLPPIPFPFPIPPPPQFPPSLPNPSIPTAQPTARNENIRPRLPLEVESTKSGSLHMQNLGGNRPRPPDANPKLPMRLRVHAVPRRYNHHPPLSRPRPRGQNLPRRQNHQRRGQKQLLHQPAKILPFPLAAAHNQRPARPHRRLRVAPQLNRRKPNLKTRPLATPQRVPRNRRPRPPRRQRRKPRPNRRRKRYNRPNPRQRRRKGQAKRRRQKPRAPRRKRQARRRRIERRIRIKNGIGINHDCKG